MSGHGAGRCSNMLVGDTMLRARKFCRYPGCPNFVGHGPRYCDTHAAEEIEEQRRNEAARDRRRGSAKQRGYDARWSRYSKWFLSRPQNQFCVLHLDDGCAGVAQCVDHIDPPEGPNDPRFWDYSNHQPACIHCNSVKGHRKLRGNFAFGVPPRGDINLCQNSK